MDDRVRAAIFRQVEKEPFAQKFGLKLVALDEGYSKVEMDFTPDMENIFGMAHGGALFALMDEAFETASNSHGTMAVALNMNITYLSSPAKREGSLPRPKNLAGPKEPPSMTSAWWMTGINSSLPAKPLSTVRKNLSLFSNRQNKCTARRPIFR